MGNTFQILNEDMRTAARRGELHTRRGTVSTPAFMPVGTQAAVKTLTPDEVRDTGSEIILANTYHLMLRPGLEVVSAAGGVHQFMNWSGPILTDSGGYQVFSLSQSRKVREEGVEFRSHIDGRKLDLTPESAIDLQLAFGSDVIMPLDELTGYDTTESEQFAAAERTLRWLARAVDHFRAVNPGQEGHVPLLFGIAQGGFDAKQRKGHSERIAEQELDGYSVGGLSVGEPKDLLFEMLEASIDGLPRKRPRYLMGVGSPEDLWHAVSLGVDMFDCVHPTRVARRGAFFTRAGRVNITASPFRETFDPPDPDCQCYTCRTFSAAYIHHLFRAGEMLGPRLATIHNLHFFQAVMREIRAAIAAGTFAEQYASFQRSYQPVDDGTARAQRMRWAERRHAQTMPIRGRNRES